MVHKEVSFLFLSSVLNILFGDGNWHKKRGARTPLSITKLARLVNINVRMNFGCLSALQITYYLKKTMISGDNVRKKLLKVK